MPSWAVDVCAKPTTQRAPIGGSRVSLAVGLFCDFMLYARVDLTNYTANTRIRGSSTCNRPSTAVPLTNWPAMSFLGPTCLHR